MAWNRRYSLISHVRSSLWIVPILAVMAAIALNRAIDRIGYWMSQRSGFDLQHGLLAVSVEEAHAILDRIFTLNLSCLVFTFGSLLVAIQVAGGQYTPRIIATTLLRDNVIRWIVGLFVFSLLWTHRTMAELGQPSAVPQLQVSIATVIGLGSLVAFIVLIDYSARLLRPVSLVGRVAEQGFAVIEVIYPHPASEESARRRFTTELAWTSRSRAFGTNGRAEPGTPGAPGAPDRIVYHPGGSGVVLAVNLAGLSREAQRAGCIIEFAAQVGDFLATDEPLFYLTGSSDTISDRRLQNLVALGSERTMEQDPMFSFRIEVDIALKALSPAINDPTTAVLAIDQLHRLLRLVGQRSLANSTLSDASGRPRVIFRTPDWEDFVHVTFREIRHCGAGSLQIERRLRAMIVNLTNTLPEFRHPALLRELELLDASIVRHHHFAADIELARVADPQGLGGALDVNAQNGGAGETKSSTATRGKRASWQGHWRTHPSTLRSSRKHRKS
ncbi:DUF2254 domain-containing protein [Paraburkholderia sp. RL17-381-BIF-C]|uniref:DUF2254 domain-containing protein n=1 Tax=Paraburkholderia sp. RL17-381-BIF-C TaxID=3031635 RepID=UPI0038BC965C